MASKIVDFGEVVIAHFRNTNDNITARRHPDNESVTLILRNTCVLSVIKDNSVYVEDGRNAQDIRPILQDIYNRCACVLEKPVVSIVKDARIIITELTNIAVAT